MEPTIKPLSDWLKGKIEIETEQKVKNGQTMFRLPTVERLLFVMKNLREAMAAIQGGDGRFFSPKYSAYKEASWKSGNVCVDYVTWLEETIRQLITEHPPNINKL